MQTSQYKDNEVNPLIYASVMVSTDLQSIIDSYTSMITGVSLGIVAVVVSLFLVIVVTIITCFVCRRNRRKRSKCSAVFMYNIMYE